MAGRDARAAFAPFPARGVPAAAPPGSLRGRRDFERPRSARFSPGRAGAFWAPNRRAGPLRSSLAQLENLCKQLYETTDTTTRLQAEKALVEFTNSPDCLNKCQLLLERGSDSVEHCIIGVTILSQLTNEINQ
ncbi:hypothetical protein E2320_006805, partial [Naja naja]